MTTKNENDKFFTSKLGKIKSKKFIEEVSKFAKKYSEENDCLFLLDNIFETKLDEFKDLFEKSNYLCKSVKNNSILLSDLCYLSPEELNPDKYKDILNKKEIEEFRKNNKGTTDAFTCKKCKCKKSVVSERQTRAGDEPATLFVTCTECGYCFRL